MNGEYLKSAGINLNEVLEFWGDIDAYSSNLLEFLNSIDSRIEDLKSYKDNNEISNYTMLAHSLKSEARYLGLNELSSVFQLHEDKGKEGNFDYIKYNFNEIEGAINKNLLVVDDSNIIINYIENIVKDEYNVVRANNGIEAVNKLNDSIYAMLLDINMPKSNGIDVLKYLNDNDLIDKVPVVIITGNDTKDAIKEVIGYQVLDVLNKPFSVDNIKRVLSLIETFHGKNE